MLSHVSKPVLSRKITRHEWRASALADTPALPWMTEDGRRIASFVLVPIPECLTGTTVVFLDAEGKPTDVRSEGPMAEMARRLRPRLAEVTLLPQ
jgi:hypothetical protein